MKSPPTTVELEGDFGHPDAYRRNDAVTRAMRLDTEVAERIAGMPGVSGWKYRSLIDTVIASTPYRLWR